MQELNKKDMTKVRVPLPQLEGIELKNATVDIENGYVVAEYGEKVQKPKFKRGDIVYHDTGVLKWVFVYTDIVDGAYKGLCCTRYDKHSYCNTYSNTTTKVIRLATDSEKQILFDALVKEGKYWDAEALEVKDIPKEEIIKNIFRELRGHNISVNEAYRQINNIIPING